MSRLSEEEYEKWKQKERKKNQKDYKTYQVWLEKVTTQWKDDEWEKFREKLDKLSLSEVRSLANKTGMKFAVGNIKITDKEEFIWILDEADKDELISEYNKLIQEKRTKGRII